MARTITTLYIDDRVLRLMICNGSKPRQWAEMPIEPGVVENMVVLDKEKFASTIRQLFRRNRIKSRKAAIAISGLRCRTRSIVLPQMPEQMLGDAVRREAKNELQVPLEQVYLSWSVIGNREDKLVVYLVATPRETIDSLLTVIRRSGVIPEFLNLKPLLLSGLTQGDSSVILDIQKSEFDIVVISEGVPQPVRTVLFPNDATDWQEKLATISGELGRTLEFYNADEPKTPFPPDAPVIISGELADEPKFCKALSDGVMRPVEKLVPPGTSLEDLPSKSYLVNLSLAHHLNSPRKNEEAVTGIHNILPSAYMCTRVSIRRLMPVAGSLAAAAIIVTLALMNNDASAFIETTAGKLSETQQYLETKQTEQAGLRETIAGLETELAGLTTPIDSISTLLDGLENQRSAISRDLSATISNLPAGISLTNIGHITSILTISGRADEEDILLSYISSLDESGRFGNITVTDMTRDEDDNLVFTLVCTLQQQSIGATSMEIALGSVPPSLVLSSVNATDTTLNIRGSSPTESKIFAYLRALEASQKFNEITVERIAKNPDGEMDFSLILTGNDL